jgi:phosphate transport system permease protein
MSPSALFFIILGICALAYYLGVRRAFSVAGGPKKVKDLHSLPLYYGWLTALWCGIPALLLFGLWVIFEDTIITQIVLDELPPDLEDVSADRMTLVVNDIRNLVAGTVASSDNPALREAAKHYSDLRSLSHAALTVASICLAALMAGFTIWRISPRLRARNKVESVAKGVMVICSTIAILTTIGIIASVG